jgi:integrase
MAHRIDTVDARYRLKPRPAPYWQKLATGSALGFRKLSKASDGTWLAQSYDSETRKQTRRSLGAFEAMPLSQRYDAAKKAAETWFEHLGRGGSTAPTTVKAACEAYVKHARADKKAAKAADLEGRYKRWIDTAPIGAVELHKLTRKHVTAWRHDLMAAPVVVNPHSEEQRTRARAPSSLNRDMTALRAALNFAHDAGHVTSDSAWRVPLRPIENASRPRETYLDRDQRSAWIENADADIGVFLGGMSRLPLRPGALALLLAGHFNKKLGVLSVGKDKHGRDRQLKLPEQTVAFLVTTSKGKLPTAPLFSRADGAAWDRHSWKKPVKAAALAAALPPNVTAYTMRHSVITDLVVGGLDLLTVAQLSGTSVAMIERHYGHLTADRAAAALAMLSL